MAKEPRPELVWTRSSRCDGGHCVEVAVADSVHVRDAKDGGSGASVEVDRAAWRAFIDAVAR